MSVRKNTVRKAFVDSLPVLMGYSAMGFAAGVLLAAHSGISVPAAWSALFGAVCVSGALQFMITGWLREMTPLLDVALITFCLNLRYSMYGISMLERFAGTGFWRKGYLIWAMTDETYALEVENEQKDRKNDIFYCICLAAMNHCYWIAGVTAGAVAGSALPFPTEGIDFAMTALFLVILTDQCREKKNRFPAVAGGVASIAAWLLLGRGMMLIPAMVSIVLIFICSRKYLEKNHAVAETEEQK